MKFSISELPQADELDRVLSTVEAVSLDNRTDEEIARYVGFTPRQGRYYRLAAEILMLLENQSNFARLTPLGQELIQLDEKHRVKRLRSFLFQYGVFEKIINFIKSNTEGVSKAELFNFLSTIVNGAESTIARRISTVINWLKYVQIITIDYRDLINGEKENIYVFNYEIIEDDVDFDNVTGSIYPVNYNSGELDIKEMYMQVYALKRKSSQNKIIIPEFQRNQVWKLQQQSRFIESLILNIPVPPFYLSQDLEGNLIIVDGLQRATAILEFLDNNYRLIGLEALRHLNGKSFDELSEEIKARIEDRTILLFVLKPTVPLPIVYDIFNRINSNGTPLTRQEIRNCVYIGKSTRLLKEMSERVEFQRAVNKGISPLRMKDREAILRFFAFSLFNYNTEYKGNLDEFLSMTMRRINLFSDLDITHLESRFLRVMELTEQFFGNYNFRIPAQTGPGPINIALMEVISVYFDTCDSEYLIQNSNAIKANYNALLNDAEFLDSIRFSTNSQKKVQTRFNKVFQYLGNPTNL